MYNRWRHQTIFNYYETLNLRYLTCLNFKVTQIFVLFEFILKTNLKNSIIDNCHDPENSRLRICTVFG